MFRVVNTKQILIPIGLIVLVLVSTPIITAKNDIQIATQGSGAGNDSDGIELPDLDPPTSTIDQFLKLIIGSNNESSATRNS